MTTVEKATILWRRHKDKEAISLLNSLDLANDGPANHLIGKIYLYAEKGVSNIKRSVREGKVHLEKALALGVPEAGLALADLYFYGYGVKVNQIKAEEYWGQSVKLGSELAAFELANYYYDVAPQKIEEAIRLYKWLIAKNEFVGSSYYKLSLIYKKGIGVPADLALSLEYLEQGAKDKHVHCCMNLALSYYRGDCVKADKQKAIALAKIASLDDLFHKEANLVLSKMEKGEPL